MRLILLHGWRGGLAGECRTSVCVGTSSTSGHEVFPSKPWTTHRRVWGPAAQAVAEKAQGLQTDTNKRTNMFSLKFLKIVITGRMQSLRETLRMVVIDIVINHPSL